MGLLTSELSAAAGLLHGSEALSHCRCLWLCPELKVKLLVGCLLLLETRPLALVVSSPLLHTSLGGEHQAAACEALAGLFREQKQSWVPSGLVFSPFAQAVLEPTAAAASCASVAGLQSCGRSSFCSSTAALAGAGGCGRWSQHMVGLPSGAVCWELSLTGKPFL